MLWDGIRDKIEKGGKEEKYRRSVILNLEWNGLGFKPNQSLKVYLDWIQVRS